MELKLFTIRWGVTVSTCLFLSTEQETISCFEECPFYKYEEGDGGCPFKNSFVHKKSSTKGFPFEYFFEDEEDITFEPSLYKEQF